MFSDYRSFAIAKSAIVSTGALAITDNSQGFMHIIAIGTVSLTGVVLRYPHETIVSDTAVTLTGGEQLGGILSCTVASGQAQVLFFKS